MYIRSQSVWEAILVVSTAVTLSLNVYMYTRLGNGVPMYMYMYAAWGDWAGRGDYFSDDLYNSLVMSWRVEAIVWCACVYIAQCMLPIDRGTMHAPVNCGLMSHNVFRDIMTQGMLPPPRVIPQIPAIDPILRNPKMNTHDNIQKENARNACHNCLYAWSQRYLSSVCLSTIYFINT